jgi:hypothetical protein
VSPADRHRLRGARAINPPACGPLVVQRRVSQRGQIMVATQRIQVGMVDARKIVTASDHSLRLDIDGETVAVVARATSSEIHRYKSPRNIPPQVSQPELRIPRGGPAADMTARRHTLADTVSSMPRRAMP